LIPPLLRFQCHYCRCSIPWMMRRRMTTSPSVVVPAISMTRNRRASCTSAPIFVVYPCSLPNALLLSPPQCWDGVASPRARHIRKGRGRRARRRRGHASILRLPTEATMEEGAANYAQHWSTGKRKCVQMGPIFVAASLQGGEWESILHILSHLILFALCVCTPR
jgi:hypothetical protein